MSRILFAGEEPVRSAPSRMLAGVLGGLGFECHFARAFWGVAATATWLQEVRQAQAVVVVMYSPPSASLLYKLAMAAAMGRPILRWWVGTDVLKCLQEKSPRWRTRLLDRLVSVNVAVAPHLVGELSSAGIKARLIPSVLDNELGRGLDRPCDAPKRSLLVYLPSERHTFFRQDIIRRAIKENEDIEFVVVADDDHSLSDLPNVRSLGWVEDMQTVWPQVGGLLRITKHDGLPRMVLECLLRGKYAIYSWPLPGCWLARTFDEVQEKIDRFRNVTTANDSGIQAARRICTPDPSEAFANVIENTDQTGALLRRLCGMGATPPLIVLMACQKLLGGFSTNP